MLCDSHGDEEHPNELGTKPDAHLHVLHQHEPKKQAGASYLQEKNAGHLVLVLVPPGA